MKIRTRAVRALAATALGVSVTAAGAVSTAGTAHAATTSTTAVSCSAVKVHTKAAKNSTVVGIAYKGDKVVYDQWAYKKSERTWYTRGKITRKSDGARISGYLLYQCANPYKSNGAPTPPIPR